MLPTPHGPTDGPVPAEAQDDAVAEGSTPDEVALLRVVEHLADVPDGDLEPGEPEQEGDADDADQDDADEDEPATDDEDEDEPAQDEPATDDAAASEPALDEPATDEPAADDTDEPDADAALDEDADDEVTDDDAPDDDAPEVTDDTRPPSEDADARDATAAIPTTPPAAPPAYEPGPVAAALSDTRHRIDELNPAERLFLGQQRALVTGLCPGPCDAAAVSALFDRVHAQWTQADDRPDVRPLADVFGVALGDLVCAEVDDLGWATCSDRYGTEIVLAREDPEVLVYPIAAVAQAWDDATPGWFLRHLETVVHGIARGPGAADD
ncbi:DUF3806 domain-containing protein [Cellulomonas xiejunii]|uniref:DUF3806 domain-containing protein n=1 Tax=Cellulomonas xiejunii TaxID=2968083 RepID=A0ABY5KTD4_9CELL|nr:DUF3806 domain-containing protein [Cellulomonas xiejunii]MCC2322459.1 DUF3806 domain-containing protein [Cellulomonas xiejunii]UUI72502.1 DUF3806 domain-containing protein [Cellulomonas xiejunii]